MRIDKTRHEGRISSPGAVVARRRRTNGTPITRVRSPANNGPSVERVSYFSLRPPVFGAPRSRAIKRATPESPDSQTLLRLAMIRGKTGKNSTRVRRTESLAQGVPYVDRTEH